MRTLFYVPVLHTKTDLGSLSDTLSEKGVALTGEKKWRKHQAAISGFWKAVTRYFGLKPMRKHTKIYQDGLAAGGREGMKIVQTVASKKSPNFQAVLALARKGAELMKTEDPLLLKQELGYARKLARASSLLDKLIAFAQYKLNARSLLEKRDAFIADNINSTLGQNEEGVLFLGAYHDVLSKLDSDIEVKQVKDREKVKRYQQIFYLRSKEKEAEALAGYLAAPVMVNS